MSEFLEKLVAPVVGDVGVQLVRYFARGKADPDDCVWTFGSWSEIADAAQVKGPGRARKVRIACNSLSAMRVVFDHRQQGFDTWLMRCSDMPDALYVTVGDGLTSYGLMHIEQIHRDYRNRVKVHVHGIVVVTG